MGGEGGKDVFFEGVIAGDKGINYARLSSPEGVGWIVRLGADDGAATIFQWGKWSCGVVTLKRMSRIFRSTKVSVDGRMSANAV